VFVVSIRAIIQSQVGAGRAPGDERRYTPALKRLRPGRRRNSPRSLCGPSAAGGPRSRPTRLIIFYCPRPGK
jgi:hypothetical protein